MPEAKSTHPNRLEDESIIDVEVVDVVSENDLEPVAGKKALAKAVTAFDPGRQKHIRLYLLVPIIFLTVTLLGGLRLASPGNDFIFLKPALLCLILALILLVLFVRGGLIALDEWVGEEFSMSANV
ncbi:MAG: hypothetical protein ABIU09_08515, partial [Pyrinomonadaceae bacterium]